MKRVVWAPAALAALLAAQALFVLQLGGTGGRVAVAAQASLVAVTPMPASALPTASPPAPRNPDPEHPAGDLIEISVAAQRLTAWRDGAVEMRLVISTGRPGFETPTGRYRILWKDPKVWSTKWEVWMPWSMNWYGNYFIHQLPHYPGSTVNIGASRLGHPDSHGCVRVNVGDAERLYRWTAVGTLVWVH